MPIRSLTRGPAGLVKKVNEIIAAVNSFNQLTSTRTGSVSVKHSNGGSSVHISPNVIEPRIPRTPTMSIRRSFVKDAPTGSPDIKVYLDEDISGEEVNVTVDIVGGGGLDSALPRLEIGRPLNIWLDNSTGVPTWRQSGNPFQGAEDCE